MKFYLLFLTLYLLYPPSIVSAENFRLDLEGGAAWQTKNNIRIPNNDEGSRFNLTDSSKGPFPAYRISGSYTFNERHVVRGVVAPLQLRTSGNFDRDIMFDGESFSPDERTSARYKFNSYRLGYRYVFLDSDTWNIQGGATIKIRDAKVQLRQGDKSARNTDIGFVPLLSARIKYQASETISLLWDIEGLAAPQGRAFDSLIGVTYDISPSFDVTLGYRTLEGGADNDTVYTFSWFHYGVVSLGYSF